MTATGRTKTSPNGKREWKIFVCDFCGAERLDFEVYGTGWPNNPQEWCLWPDHTPRARRGFWARALGWWRDRVKP